MALWENRPITVEAAKDLMSMPLEDKLGRTSENIAAWDLFTEGRWYVSFSGGKDSTVLLYMCAKMMNGTIAGNRTLHVLFCDTGLLAGVSLERGNNYLRTFDGRDGLTLRAAPQFWFDYLTAARLLRYDLGRDDVRMPRDLARRHDDAMGAAEIVKDKKRMKRCAARYQALAAQFEFAEDGLMIAAPRRPDEIVTEGATLRHCVGGYAALHVDGKVTILFLRKEKAPIAPYVTIEMSTEHNCKDLSIRQIHGFRNDLGGPSPRETHAAFLERWLDWVHSGSPRDGEGRPVTPEKAARDIEWKLSG